MSLGHDGVAPAFEGCRLVHSPGDASARTGISFVYRLQENLLYGRFVFVDDLVVQQEFRRDGVGARLLSVARAYARETSCRHFVLDTGLHMALAQRFYFRQGLLAHAMGFSETLFDADGAAPLAPFGAPE